jgi:hypothetical protein
LKRIKVKAHAKATEPVTAKGDVEVAYALDIPKNETAKEYAEELASSPKGKLFRQTTAMSIAKALAGSGVTCKCEFTGVEKDEKSELECCVEITGVEAVETNGKEEKGETSASFSFVKEVDGPRGPPPGPRGPPPRGGDNSANIKNNTSNSTSNSTSTAGNSTATAANSTSSAGNSTTAAGNTTATAGNTTSTAGNTTSTAGNTTSAAGVANGTATTGNATSTPDKSTATHFHTSYALKSSVGEASKLEDLLSPGTGHNPLAELSNFSKTAMESYKTAHKITTDLEEYAKTNDRHLPGISTGPGSFKPKSKSKPTFKLTSNKTAFNPAETAVVYANGTVVEPHPEKLKFDFEVEKRKLEQALADHQELMRKKEEAREFLAENSPKTQEELKKHLEAADLLEQSKEQKDAIRKALADHLELERRKAAARQLLISGSPQSEDEFKKHQEAQILLKKTQEEMDKLKSDWEKKKADATTLLASGPPKTQIMLTRQLKAAKLLGKGERDFEALKKAYQDHLDLEKQKKEANELLATGFAKTEEELEERLQV